MSEVTVKQLANTVGIPVGRLLSQLHEAGISAADGEALLTEQERLQLLSYLRRSHGKKEAESGGAPNRVTLKRKSVSELRQPVASPRAAGNVRAATAPRAKVVNVEVRRKRTYVKRPPTASETEPVRSPPPVPTESPRVEVRRSRVDDARRRAELEARRAEEEARRLAEQEVQAQEERERQAREEEAKRQAEEEARRLAEQAAREERERQAREEKAKRLAEEEAARKLASAAEEEKKPAVKPAGAARVQKKIAPRAKPDGSKPGVIAEEETGGKGRKSPRAESTDKERSAKKAARKDSLRARELLPQAEYEEEEQEASPAAARRPRRKKRAAKPQLQDKHGFQRPTARLVREVEIPETIGVGELAARMSVKAGDVIRERYKQGMAVTINQTVDRDTATLVGEEMGHKAVSVEREDAEDALMRQLESELGAAADEPRPPVVTIMGHVDHGKTSLLDHIRRTRVAAGEAGGITQHIGAYHVKTGRGMISFLDTPGHAAFSAMRARGARVTDLVILVVAADDGVMPQTVEAIQHARASRVPVVVAINKIDKANANPDRVMQELTQHELVPEEWGGDTMMVQVSAKTGLGIDELLDAVLLQAEVLELAAPTDGPARGAIIESSLDRGRGPVATVLVQAGTLRQGDMIVSGTEFGRVRAMFDETGQPVKSAGPSIPVQVLGLSNPPHAGDDVVVVVDEKRAREVALLRSHRERQSRLDEPPRLGAIDDLFSHFKEGEAKSVNLILKADVQGSMEALRESLLKLSTDEVKVVIVATGVGGITESDANLAVTSQAVLLGFNVRADAAARRVVEEKGLDLRYYSIIYELIDDVKKALTGLLSPEITEEIIGLAQVRDVFRSSKFGAIAGCMVVEGLIKRNNPIRVLRDHVVVYDGALESLRRFKEDVQEVKAGTECGIGVKNYNDVRVGDQIEVFERTVHRREL